MNYGGLDRKHTFFIYDNGRLFSQFAIRLSQQGHEVYYYTPFTSNVYFKEYAVGLNIENVQKPLYFFEKLLKYKKEDITIMFPDVGMGDLAHFLKQMGYAVFAAGRGDILEFHRDWLKKELPKLGLPVMDYAVIEGITALKNYLKKKNGERVVKLDIFRADAECVDEKTEIFTDKGWRFFYQLTPEDKVLTMNPITRETFFVKPKKIINSFYKGKMYQIKTKKVDLFITPNHHLFVHNNYKNKKLAGVKKLKYRKVADLVKNLKSEKSGFTLPVYFKWKGINKKFYIIKSIKKQNHHLPDKNKKIPMNLWLQFLGWFLSEGCLSEHIGKHKYKYRISITQSKNKNFKKWSEIKELLNKLGYNYQIERNVGFSIYNKSLFYELINTCYLNKKCEICGRDYCSHNKKVPDYVKELSSSQIKTFLDAFQKGDGCINNGEIRYYSSSKKLINDLQELVFKVGKIGSIRFRKKGSHFRNGKIIQDRVEPGQVSALSNDAFVSKNKIKEVDYKGFIYDVVVEPYHTILLRRNYKVVWSGNSWFAQDVNKIDLKLNRLISKFGPFAEEYFFIVEEKIEGDEEPGFDLIFNSEDYIKPYLWGYEIAKGPYCG
ncbi:MAG: LAGLIDADG family homing endonuclease, partial [Candidatus Pacearchaeota archaeon]